MRSAAPATKSETTASTATPLPAIAIPVCPVATNAARSPARVRAATSSSDAVIFPTAASEPTVSTTRAPGRRTRWPPTSRSAGGSRSSRTVPPPRRAAAASAGSASTRSWSPFQTARPRSSAAASAGRYPSGMRPPAAAVPTRTTVAPIASAAGTSATTGTPFPTPTHSAASFPARVESMTATVSNGAYRRTPIAVFAVARANWPSARIATRGAPPPGPRLMPPGPGSRPRPRHALGPGSRAAQVAPEAEEATVPLGRGLAVLDREAAVDDDVLDPDRVPMRIVVRRRIDDACGIEDDQVSASALTHDTPVIEAQPGRGERGHLAHGVGEREDLLVASVPAEHPREGPVGPRMWLSERQRAVRRVRARVAADADPVLRHDVADIVLAHRVVDDVDGALVLDERVAGPFERIAPGLARELLDALAGPVRMLAGTGDHDAVP